MERRPLIFIGGAFVSGIAGCFESNSSVKNTEKEMVDTTDGAEQGAKDITDTQEQKDIEEFEVLKYRHESVSRDDAVIPFSTRDQAERFDVPDHIEDEYGDFIDKTDFETESIVVVQIFYPSNEYELEINSIDAGTDLAVEAVRKHGFGNPSDIYDIAMTRISKRVEEYEELHIRLDLKETREGEPDSMLLRPNHSADYTRVDLRVGNRNSSSREIAYSIEDKNGETTDGSTTVNSSELKNVHRFERGGVYSVEMDVKEGADIEEELRLPISSPEYLPAGYEFWVTEDGAFEVRVGSVE
jgi:hypothetical protein